jgi:TonB family protein
MTAFFCNLDYPQFIYMKHLLLVIASCLSVPAFAQDQHNHRTLRGNDMALVTQERVLPPNDNVVPIFPGQFRSDVNETQFYADMMQYPAAAKAAGLMGVVRLSSVITADGKVTEVRVTQSLSPETDAEAIRLVQLHSWYPAKKDYKPVSMPWKHEVHFRL